MGASPTGFELTARIRSQSKVSYSSNPTRGTNTTFLYGVRVPPYLPGLLVGKILLKDYDANPELTGEELFPPKSDDDLYELLLNCKPELGEVVRYGY